MIMKRKHTHQAEKKRYPEDKEFVRGKRAPNNLIDTFDTRFCKVSKSWKFLHKKRRQYNDNKYLRYIAKECIIMLNWFESRK